MQQQQYYQQNDNVSPMRTNNGQPQQQYQDYHDENGSPGSQQQQYQDYDGSGSQQYGPNGEPVSKKLVDSRHARKRAEEDVKLLANRIQLLKIEEKKAWKKIEDTKKKAKEIMSVKQRNQEQQRIKEQRQNDKQMEERMLAERNMNMKHTIKETIQMTKEQHQRKLYEEAERLKNEKREQKELMYMQKQQEQLKNASMKQMIKSQQQEVEEKKRREQAEKKAQTRQQLQQKIMEENQRRILIEQEVSKMEQEELELIQKLQNTQIIQKAAYEDLETALNGQVSPDQQQQNQNREYSPMKASCFQHKSLRHFKIFYQFKHKYLKQSKLIAFYLFKGKCPYQGYDSPGNGINQLGASYRSLSQIKTRPGDAKAQASKADLLMKALSQKIVQLTGVSKIVSTNNGPNGLYNTMGKRRVHYDGVHMLDKHMNMKDSVQQMTIMENRIKRLMFEEDRAKKLQSMAQQKADKMLEARDRHQKELEDKFRYYENRMNTVSQLKEKHLQEKLQRSENIKKVKEELQQRNKQNKEDLVQQKQSLMEIKVQNINEDQTQKKGKKFEIISQKNEHLNKKINHLEQQNLNLKQNYSSKMLDKHLTTGQVQDKIKALEQYEMLLIDRLKGTHQKQQGAYKDLEKIVHESYGYYLNSFKEKRDRHQSLYSNGNSLAKSRNEGNQSVSLTMQPSQRAMLNKSTIDTNDQLNKSLL